MSLFALLHPTFIFISIFPLVLSLFLIFSLPCNLFGYLSLYFPFFCVFLRTTLTARGKYHCMADHQLSWVGFYQTRFLLFACTETKLLNPNQSNWRQAVQWYLPPTLSVLWFIIHAAFSLINLQLFVVLSQCHRLLNKCTPQKEENNSIEGHKGTAKYQSLQCILFDSHHWSVCYSESTFLNCQSQIWLIGG